MLEQRLGRVNSYNRREFGTQLSHHIAVAQHRFGTTLLWPYAVLAVHRFGAACMRGNAWRMYLRSPFGGRPAALVVVNAEFADGVWEQRLAAIRRLSACSTAGVG